MSSPFVSRAELLSMFDGDTAFVQELVAMFLGRYPALLGEIRSAFHAGDAVAVSRAAHSLKGEMGYFQRSDAADVIHQIERTTPAELQRVPPLLNVLESGLGDLARHLAGIFPQ